MPLVYDKEKKKREFKEFLDATKEYKEKQKEKMKDKKRPSTFRESAHKVGKGLKGLSFRYKKPEKYDRATFRRKFLSWEEF